MKYLFFILLSLNALSEENVIKKTERQLRIEFERDSYNGKVWVKIGDLSKNYPLKIFCEDEHGVDACREFPTDQEKEDSDAAKEVAKQERLAKKNRLKELRDKPGNLSNAEIKEILKLLIN